MIRQDYLKYFEEKLILNLDYKFLEEIKSRLPYNNIYFIVCMIELLNKFLEEDRYYDSFDNILKELIDGATIMYLTENISSNFRINLEN
jgi:hypothetical protein